MSNERIEESSYETPILEVARRLIASQAEPLTAPRSFMIKPPRDVREFAEGLRALTELPYEFLITFDRTRGRFILTTGEPGKSKHDWDFSSDERLLSGSPGIHPHPFFGNTDKFTPSPSDLRQLVQLYTEFNGYSFSLLITKGGITRCAFESTPPSDTALQQWWSKIEEEHDLPEVEDSRDLTAEQWAQIMIAEQELAQKANVSIERISWNDVDRINAVLTEFEHAAKTPRDS